MCFSALNLINCYCEVVGRWSLCLWNFSFISTYCTVCDKWTAMIRAVNCTHTHTYDINHVIYICICIAQTHHREMALPGTAASSDKVRVCVCGEDAYVNHPYIWQQLKCINIPHSHFKFMGLSAVNLFPKSPFYGPRSHCWDFETQHKHTNLHLCHVWYRDEDSTFYTSKHMRSKSAVLL